MKRLLTLFISFLPIIGYAQSNNLLEIDADTFAPVQTDVMTGVSIDKIGTDPSKRPCARIKMHINRMTKEDIEGLVVRTIGGSTVVTRQVVSTEGNGMIIEMTAKTPTRFYLHHEKYGDSNEISVNLEGNKEYKIEAMLNTTLTIVVSSNLENSDVYIDDVYKGVINENYTLTVSDIYPGNHKITVKSGSLSSTEEVEVSAVSVYFRINVNHELAKPQYVVFQVEPKTASLTIDDKNYPLDEYGQCTVVLNNGSYNYSITANEYHTENGTFIVNGKKIEKTVTLKPAHGWLTVPATSTLKGAIVSVDGTNIGRAPITSHKLPSGPHTVSIQQEMYKTHEAQITIQDGQTLEHKPSLSEDFATVTLDAGEGFSIFVNDLFKGMSPWTGNLASGTYIIEARKEGYRNSRITPTITQADNKKTFQIPSPTPILGWVDINSTPGLADVYIDNELVGRTPLTHEAIIGQHTITIKKEGYQTQNITAEIKRRETTKISVELTTPLSDYSSSTSQTGRTSGSSSSAQYGKTSYGQTASSTSGIVTDSRSRKGTKNWDIFNLGVFTDLAMTSTGNATDFGIGLGVTCRMSRYDSSIIPTIGFRYMYDCYGEHTIGFPVMLNVKWRRSGGYDYAMYSGIGMEPYYRNKCWSAGGLAFNLLGYSSRNLDIVIYCNFRLDEKKQENTVEMNEGEYVGSYTESLSNETTDVTVSTSDTAESYFNAMAGVRFTWFF